MPRTVLTFPAGSPEVAKILACALAGQRVRRMQIADINGDEWVILDAIPAAVAPSTKDLALQTFEFDGQVERV
ncbi:MAG: hypothetical protein ABI639_16625 [Thermoanaerobaculia bacterium]